jgi:hypothetical protein
VTGLLNGLGQKLAERWVTLLGLPGALFLATAAAARTLGHAHALDLARLTGRISGWAKAPVATSLGGQVVVLGAVVVAAAAAGLAAQALGAGVQRVALAADWHAWPRPLDRAARVLVTRRRARWAAATERYRRQRDADARALARDGQRADPARRRAAYHAVRRIAEEEPERPTWSGDQVHAVEARLGRDHHVDLPLLWPHLWLVLPESTRDEITAVEQALVRACALGGWALMYAALTVWWWPAAPLAAAVALTARHRVRAATALYARLLEAAARLHLTDLASQLGIDHTGPADTALGEALTRRLRASSTGRPRPSSSSSGPPAS